MTGMYGTDGDDLGHGWVTPRPDRLRADCGGPEVCPLCIIEASEQFAERDAVERRRAARAAMSRQPVGHDRRIVLGVPPRSAGGPGAAGPSGMAWRAVCTCGDWSSWPIPHHLGMDSREAEQTLKTAWQDHYLEALASMIADMAARDWAVTPERPA